jgi:hemin uptake protein HemP
MPAKRNLHPEDSRRTSALQAVAPSAPARTNPAPVESQMLFQGQRAIAISHNGEIYRQQATRLGKLILTK